MTKVAIYQKGSIQLENFQISASLPILRMSFSSAQSYS